MRSGTLMTEDRFDLSASATDPNLASRIRNAQDVYLEGASHFIPMEYPELIAASLLKIQKSILAADERPFEDKWLYRRC